MVLIEAGEFEMGSWELEQGRRADETQHRVEISRPFYIGVCEVTQEEYQKVMGVNPSAFAAGSRDQSKIGKNATARHPVESVSWFDAVEFCNRLSVNDKLDPYYRLTDVTRDKNSINGAVVTMLGGPGYRLPTEAEWEYACRAGTKSIFFFGGVNTGREANLTPPVVAGGYGGSFPKWQHSSRPSKVGSYEANDWKLHDTHGNVAEWCWDWYSSDYYTKSPATDPQGPETGKQRVVRGGSWLVTEKDCRSASRYWLTPDECKNYVGFRVVRNADASDTGR